MDSKRYSPLRIAVLEDNPYYQQILCQQIDSHARELARKKPFEFELDRFEKYEDFLTRFKRDTQIVFVDFNLDKPHTGLDVLRQIRKVCVNCKVIVISDSSNIWNMYLCLLEGATGIIVKDNMMPTLCAYVIDQHLKHARI